MTPFKSMPKMFLKEKYSYVPDFSYEEVGLIGATLQVSCLIRKSAIALFTHLLTLPKLTLPSFANTYLNFGVLL